MLCNRRHLPQTCGDLSFCSLAVLLVLCQIALSNHIFFFLENCLGQLQNRLPAQSMELKKQNFSQSYRFVVCIHVHMYVCIFQTAFLYLLSSCVLCWELHFWFVDFFFFNLKLLHQPYEFKTKSNADRLQKTVIQEPNVWNLSFCHSEHVQIPSPLHNLVSPVICFW